MQLTESKGFNLLGEHEDWSLEQWGKVQSRFASIYVVPVMQADDQVFPSRDLFFPPLMSQPYSKVKHECEHES